MPFGRKLLPPSSGGMLVSRLASNDPVKSTATKKNPRMPSASTVITTVNRMVISMPMMLIPTKMM